MSDSPPDAPLPFPPSYLGWVLLAMFSRSQDKMEQIGKLHLEKLAPAVSKVLKRPMERLSDVERAALFHAVIVDTELDVPVDDLVSVFKAAKLVRDEEISHNENVVFTMPNPAPDLVLTLELHIRRMVWLQAWMNWISTEGLHLTERKQFDGTGWNRFTFPLPSKAKPN